MAESRLALGRKLRKMVGSSVVGMMGKMGMKGTLVAASAQWLLELGVEVGKIRVVCGNGS